MNVDLDRLRDDLLRFYDRHRRDLPWRGEEDPYRILVSEVMLQQTRVETVKEYYGPWLERFPDVEALAAADEGEVLKAWEGLGYYRRARNLRTAAMAVREEWDGRLPRTAEELRRLPGVGAYTAGAVASIAFGQGVPAVDGNVRRVLARLFDVAAPGAAWLRDAAGRLVDPERPGDWNQALMELGATVCVPRVPRCAACPVAWACRARAAGTVDERPAPATRRTPRAAVIALAVLRRASGTVLLTRRPDDGLLGGMWAFPEREVAAPVDAEAAVRELAGSLLSTSGARKGLPPGSAEPLPVVRHRFTHLEATYVPFVVEVGRAGAEDSGSAGDRSTRLRWAGRAELARLALPAAQRQVLDSLTASGRIGHGGEPR